MEQGDWPLAHIPNSQGDYIMLAYEIEYLEIEVITISDLTEAQVKAFEMPAPMALPSA